MRVPATISLTEKQFAWAREQMVANDWDRAGGTEGISRYVQELIRKDMPKDWQRKTPPDPSRKLSPEKVGQTVRGQRPKRDRQKPSEN